MDPILFPHDHAASKTRCDEKLHMKVKYFTESNGFNGFIIFTILLNSVFIALETDDDIKLKYNLMLGVVDYTCLAIYTIEFVLKIYAEPFGYWTSAYNVFDFIVLMISCVQVVLDLFGGGDSRFGSLKVLRALRTLRTLRTVSFIKGLKVLVTALLDTLRKWVTNIILLLLLLMFLFATIGYHFFGASDDGDKENWGSLGAAMMTLFSFVTVDGWTDLQHELEIRGYGWSRIYTIIFIFLGHFIFTNIFIGVIILNISEATEKFEKEEMKERAAVLKHKKEFMMMRQHQDIQQMLDKQRKGNYTNFYEMVEEYQRSLKHTDSVTLSDLCTNILWIETMLHTLDFMDSTMYRLQQLHFEMAYKLSDVLERKLREKYGTEVSDVHPEEENIGFKGSDTAEESGVKLRFPSSNL